VGTISTVSSSTRVNSIVPPPFLKIDIDAHHNPASGRPQEMK